jgi:hypothetical protein
MHGAYLQKISKFLFNIIFEMQSNLQRKIQPLCFFYGL